MSYERYRTLAELVHGARLIEEMTLQAVSEAAGVSKSYLSEIEHGVSWKISIQLADKISTALCIPLARLAQAAHESELEAREKNA